VRVRAAVASAATGKRQGCGNESADGASQPYCNRRFFSVGFFESQASTRKCVVLGEMDWC